MQCNFVYTKLHQMVAGFPMEQDSTCSCGAPVESAAHVMLRCPTLSNAITVAHDSILSSIRTALRDQCPHVTQHWCTTAGSLFPGLTTEFPSLAPHLDRPRFVNLERQVSDASFQVVQRDPGRDHRTGTHGRPGGRLLARPASGQG